MLECRARACREFGRHAGGDFGSAGLASAVGRRSPSVPFGKGHGAVHAADAVRHQTQAFDDRTGGHAPGRHGLGRRGLRRRRHSLFRLRDRDCLFAPRLADLGRRVGCVGSDEACGMGKKWEPKTLTPYTLNPKPQTPNPKP